MIKDRQEFEKLAELEKELVVLITNTRNVQLMDKFSQWQNQRTKCNKSVVSRLDMIEKRLKKQE